MSCREGDQFTTLEIGDSVECIANIGVIPGVSTKFGVVAALEESIVTVSYLDGSCGRVFAADLRPALAWRTVHAVLHEEGAAKLRNDTATELTDPAFVRKALKSMARNNELQCQGQGLVVVGPSGVGKSYALEHAAIALPAGAFWLDGSFIRDSSVNWKHVITLAESKGIAGFSDYFRDFFKSFMDIVKEQIVDEAISIKANLVIPDTSSNFKSLEATICKLVRAGYSLQFVGIYADRAVCESRGLQRETKEGKKFSSKNWLTSVQSILKIQKHLEAFTPEQRATILNNTCKCRPISRKKLEQLVEDSQTVKSPVHGGWCETKLLAGVYMDSDEGCEFEFRPMNFNKDRTCVQVLSQEDRWLMKFDVSTCTLTTRDEGQTFRLGVGPLGQACLTTADGSRQLLQVAPIDGLSLPCPVQQDTVMRQALGGLNFLGERLREVKTEEFDALLRATGCKGPEAAALGQEQPRALIVVAPSAAGIASAVRYVAEMCGMSLETCVKIDDEHFQNFHEQYAEIIRNGRINRGCWYHAWQSGYEVLENAKSTIFKLATEQRQDVLLCAGVVKRVTFLETIFMLKASGYTVNICALYTDPAEISVSVISPELEAGRHYHRDHLSFRDCFTVFSLGVKEANGMYCIMHCPGDQPPEVYAEGKGGENIVFDLDKALAWRRDKRVADSPKKR